MKNIKTFGIIVLFCSAVFFLINCSKKNSDLSSTPILPPVTDLPNNSTLVHPGILNTNQQMAFFVAKVKAGEEPWLTAYNQLKNSPFSSLSYVYKPFISVDCGSYNKLNVGCDQQVADGMAVYCDALMYMVNKDERYAQKAIEILNAWSATYQKNTESNSRLVVAWATPWYANGAEILRYNYPGWKDSDTESFSKMLDKFLPYVTDETMPGNNWIQSAIEAHLAIAVFKNDGEMFDVAVARWKNRVKTYIYQKTDGTKPVNSPGKSDSQTASVWRDDASSTAYVDGMAMETCRDLGHLGLGFGSMIYSAEIAYNQKVDLFSLEKKRLSDFMELHGSWMTGAKAVPTNICDGKIRISEADTQGISSPKGGGETSWEIAYSNLHDRLKIDLPNTLKMLNDKRPQSIAKWVSKGETLTHAGQPF